MKKNARGRALQEYCYNSLMMCPVIISLCTYLQAVFGTLATKATGAGTNLQNMSLKIQWSFLISVYLLWGQVLTKNGLVQSYMCSELRTPLSNSD